MFPRSKKLVGRVDRASLVSGEPGRITIAVPFQASCVISCVLRVRQCLGFGGSQVGIVTSVLPVAASRQVALVFGVGYLFRLLRSEFGVVALFPAIRTILSVAPEFRSGRVPGLRRSQLVTVA